MFTSAQIARFGITITTVDPSQGIVKGVMKGDSQERGISIIEIPNAFRWPTEGETWIVEQKNGIWYLAGYVPNQPVPTTIQDIAAGDLVLESPTGVIHVMGSTDGSTDFTLAKPIAPAHAPQLGFSGNLVARPTRSGVSSNVNLVTL